MTYTHDIQHVSSLSLIVSFFLKKGIPFETEEDLREKGTARTPDILLSIPIAIPMHGSTITTTNKNKYFNTKTSPTTIHDQDGDNNNNNTDIHWKVICWIDSKAMFGDVYTHNTTVLPQAESYVHRFGPGLVLYWFGHAPLERLQTSAGGDVQIAGWQLPLPLRLPHNNGSFGCQTGLQEQHLEKTDPTTTDDDKTMTKPTH